MSEPIMLLTTEMRPGGAERIVHDLALHLDRSRYEPVVCALDGRGEMAERIRAGGVEVYDLGARTRTDFGAIWRLRKLLRKKRIRLLHTHLIHATVVGRLAARPLRIPTVATSHIVERRPVGWHFWLDRLTSAWCRREICVSEAVRRFQIEKTGLPPSFFTVIHNGIDLNRFQSAPGKQECRADLAVPEGKLLVGALGRFDRQKGLDVFLRALAELKDVSDLPNWHGVLAGYGPEEARLRALRKELGLDADLTMAGYREAERFLSALDLCVVPSRWEGFGLVAVEAMACGVPVIASRVDSIPELIEDGRDGTLVPPDDPAALAQALAELLKDTETRARLGNQARSRAEQFSLTTMIDAHQRLYREVTGRWEAVTGQP